MKEKIGLNERYEEYAIHDTDNFPIDIGECVSIEELNEMYEMIEELPDYIVECLDEFISYYGTLEEVVEHKDDIYFYPDCETMTDVAYYYIDELNALGIFHPACRTTLTMKPTGEIWIWAVASLKQARYVRDTILTLENQQQELLLLTAYFSFKGQSETWLSFSI